MTTVSVFRNHQLTANRPFSNILLQIQKGTDREIVENYRQLLFDGKDDWADQLLFQLPYFTPAGRFLAIRRKDDLVQYSRFIMLETNPLRERDIAETRQTIIADPQVYACFRNIAGNALVLLVPVETEAHQHPRSFSRLHDYLCNSLGLALSSAGFRLTDVCYCSYDPDAYINPDATPFPLQPMPTQFPPKSNATAIPADKVAALFNPLLPIPSVN